MNKNKYFYTNIRKCDIINQKGFTLVELILTLAITMILMTIIFSFLLNYVKLSDTINNDLTLQDQAREAFNLITDKIMQSNEIVRVYKTSVEGSQIDITDNITKQSICSINLKYDADKYYSLYLKDNNLYFDSVSNESGIANISDSNIIAQYVKDIYAEPLNDKSFSDTNLVNITINFKKGTEEYSINQNICIRNK